jgi:hypothetical protein
MPECVSFIDADAQLWQKDVFMLFCQLKARVPEFDAVFSVKCTLYSPQLVADRGCVSNSWTLASNWQNTHLTSLCEDYKSPFFQDYLNFLCLNVSTEKLTAYCTVL